MGRCLGLVVVLAGCGRVNFDPLARGDGDGDSGTTGDGAVATDCWPAWKAGTMQVGTPRLLTELGATVKRGDPSPTPDGLTLYYVEEVTDSELHVATRSQLGDPWTPRGLITELSSPNIDTKLTMTADGLTGVYASNRVTGADTDIWMVTRSTPTGTFNTPTTTLLTGVNTTNSEFDPHLTADGLHLYYAPDVGTGQIIKLAVRDTTAVAFTPFRDLTELAMPDSYSDPTVSPDELVIAYAAQLNAKLYYAVRTDRTQPFGAPQLVPNVNGGTGRQTDVELTSDGCELYSSSTRSGTKEIYVSVVTP